METPRSNRLVKFCVTFLLLYLVGVTYYAGSLYDRIGQRDVTIAMWQGKAAHYEESYNDSVSSCEEASQFMSKQNKLKEFNIKTSQIKTQERLKDIVYSKVKIDDEVKETTPANGDTAVSPNLVRMLNTAFCAKSGDTECNTSGSNKQSKP